MPTGLPSAHGDPVGLTIEFFLLMVSRPSQRHSTLSAFWDLTGERSLLPIFFHYLLKT